MPQEIAGVFLGSHTEFRGWPDIASLSPFRAALLEVSGSASLLTTVSAKLTPATLKIEDGTILLTSAASGRPGGVASEQVAEQSLHDPAGAATAWLGAHYMRKGGGNAPS